MGNFIPVAEISVVETFKFEPDGSSGRCLSLSSVDKHLIRRPVPIYKRLRRALRELSKFSCLGT